MGIYGGYFAAAQGILLVGVMGALLPETMQRMNGAKNLLTLVVNIVAATAYTLVAFDRINWAAAGLIAAGSLIGGFVGAHYGRRLSPVALRGGDRGVRADRVVAAAGDLSHVSASAHGSVAGRGSVATPVGRRPTCRRDTRARGRVAVASGAVAR